MVANTFNFYLFLLNKIIQYSINKYKKYRRIRNICYSATFCYQYRKGLKENDR